MHMSGSRHVLAMSRDRSSGVASNHRSTTSPQGFLVESMRPGGPGPPPRHRCLIAALVCLRAGTAPGPGASAFSPSAVQWGSGRAGTVRRRLPLPSLPAPPPRQAEAKGGGLGDLGCGAKAAEDALELRRRAREMREEAERAERALREESGRRKEEADADLDALIDELAAASAAAAGAPDADADAGGEAATSASAFLRTRGALRRLARAAIGGIGDIGGRNGAVAETSMGDGEAATAAEGARICRVAAKLRDGGLPSASRLTKIAERMHERETVLGQGGGFGSGPGEGPVGGGGGGSGIGSGSGQGFGDTQKGAASPSPTSSTAAETTGKAPAFQARKSERAKLHSLMDCIVEAVSLLEGEGEATWKGSAPSYILRAKVRELRRADEEDSERKVSAALTRNQREVGGANAAQASNHNIFSKFFGSASQHQSGSVPLDELSQQIKPANATQSSVHIVEVPIWFPLGMLPFLVACDDEEMEKDDVTKLRTEVLAGSKFLSITSDSTKYASIFRGKFIQPIATSSPPTNVTNVPMSQAVFSSVQERLKDAGLEERIQLFLLEDPEWIGTDEDTSLEPSPVILATSSGIKPSSSIAGGTIGIKILSVVATLYATVACAISSYALQPSAFHALMENDPSIFRQCLPFSVGILSFMTLYELARAVVARRNGVRIGLPIPIPSFQIGTYGFRTQFLSFPKSRKVLLDIALSGPAVTMLLSCLLVSSGLVITTNSSLNQLENMPFVPAGLMKSSFFVGALVMRFAPKAMMLPLSQPIPVHPLFIVGFTGLIVSAANLLPVGRLDGGRAFLAVFGRRNANLASFLTLFILLLSVANGSATISFFWVLFVLLSQRQAEIPLQDEVTGVDSPRTWALVVFLSFSGLILAPFPAGPASLNL